MKVTITYYDHEALTKKEVVRRAEQNYGEGVEVTVSPDTDDPLDMLYFCMQRLLTYDQLTAYFDSPHAYSSLLQELKAKTLALAESEIGKVIKDNEIKVK